MADPASKLSSGAAAAHKPAHAAPRIKDRRPNVPQAECDASFPI
jgi:hypothetical protein